jgi:hypothetical protein
MVQYGYRDEDDDESEDESSRGHGFLGGIINRPQAQRKGSKGGLTAFLNESASRFGSNGKSNKNNEDEDSDDSGGSKSSVAEKAKKTLKNLGKGLRFGRNKKHENEESSSSEEESNVNGKEEESSDEEEDMNRSVSSIASQTLKRVTGKVSNVLGLGRRRGEEESDSEEEEEEQIIATHTSRRRSDNFAAHQDAQRRRASERETHEIPSAAAPFRRTKTTTEPNAARQGGGNFRASTGSTGSKGTPRRNHTSDNLWRSKPPVHATHSPRTAKSGSPLRDRNRDRVIPKEAALALTRDTGSSGFLQTKQEDDMDESDRIHHKNSALFNPAAQYGKQPTPSVPDWSMNVTEELWEQAMSDVEGDGNKKKWKMNVPKKLLKD